MNVLERCLRPKGGVAALTKMTPYFHKRPHAEDCVQPKPVHSKGNVSLTGQIQ